MIVYSVSNQNQRLNVPFTATITIKLGDKEFILDRFGTQGNSGAAYKVRGQAAFAKTNFETPIAGEAEATRLV